jgi:hypothetical protein
MLLPFYTSFKGLENELEREQWTLPEAILPEKPDEKARQPISAAAKDRIEKIMEDSISKILRKYQHQRGNITEKKLLNSISAALSRNCNKLLQASQITKPNQAKEMAKGLLEDHKKTRLVLSRDLKEARANLKNYRKEIEKLRQACNQINRLFSLDYPPPPPPCVKFTKTGEGLPMESGIYFGWNGSCVYVGQSIKLKQRASAGHGSLRDGDLLSWLLFPQSELNFAESFYIGALRPVRNFGNWSK